MLIKLPFEDYSKIRACVNRQLNELGKKRYKAVCPRLVCFQHKLFVVRMSTVLASEQYIGYYADMSNFAVEINEQLPKVKDKTDWPDSIPAGSDKAGLDICPAGNSIIRVSVWPHDMGLDVEAHWIDWDEDVCLAHRRPFPEHYDACIGVDPRILLEACKRAIENGEQTVDLKLALPETKGRTGIVLDGYYTHVLAMPCRR